MIVVSVIVVASILALAAVLFLVGGRLRAVGSADTLAMRLRPIDVAAFRNLMDEREENFLRERLAPSDFRRIHRERTLAATEYIWGATRNAGVLIKLGEAALHDPDPAVQKAAERLQANAFRLRLYALRTLPGLYVGMLAPRTTRAPRGIAEHYDTLTRQMVTLNCLQSPSRGGSGLV